VLTHCINSLIVYHKYCWYCKWTTSRGWQEWSQWIHACVAGLSQ